MCYGSPCGRPWSEISERPRKAYCEGTCHLLRNCSFEQLSGFEVDEAEPVLLGAVTKMAEDAGAVVGLVGVGSGITIGQVTQFLPEASRFHCVPLANNRLKLAARGRPVAAWSRCSRAAA